MAEQDRVHFRYSKSENYRIVPTTGVWGGITPEGQIFANFFIDHPQIPETVTNKLSSDGRPGEEIERTLRDADGFWFHRRLEVGIVMGPGMARSAGQWLIQKADEFDEKVRRQPKGE